MVDSSSTSEPIPLDLEYIPELMDKFRSNRQLRKIRKGLHVLVVEDQAFSRRLMQQFFWQICSVDAAAQASEALTLYMGNAPNIAFLDIDLPDGSGHLLATMMKKIDPDSFVVMVTANHTAEDVIKAKDNNVDGYIVKPFSKQKIIACLDRYTAAQTTQQVKGRN